MAVVLKKRVPNSTPSTPPSTPKQKAVPNVGKVVLPKGDKDDVAQKKAEPTKPEVQTKAGAEPKAPKPAVPRGERAEARGLGRSTEGEGQETAWVSFRDMMPTHDKQVKRVALETMSFTERYELWKEINLHADQTEFITLLKPYEIPKQVVMEFPHPKAKAPSNQAMWCCYCGEWMKFRHFTWTGYNRCIGCGMSDKDFYIRRANKLWKE